MAGGSQTVQLSGVPANDVREYYYTGKNIAATNGGRTANTTDLLVGDVLAIDPFGYDKGRGFDAANPTATWISQPLIVVTRVPKNSRRGGPISGVPLRQGCVDAIAVSTKANMVAGITALIPTTMASAAVNQRYLVASTGIGSAEAILSFKAKASETVDTSAMTVEVDGQAAMKKVVNPL